jgi:hypothetical protein
MTSLILKSRHHAVACTINGAPLFLQGGRCLNRFPVSWEMTRPDRRSANLASRALVVSRPLAQRADRLYSWFTSSSTRGIVGTIYRRPASGSSPLACAPFRSRLTDIRRCRTGAGTIERRPSSIRGFPLAVTSPGASPCPFPPSWESRSQERRKAFLALACGWYAVITNTNDFVPAWAGSYYDCLPSIVWVTR